MYEIRTPAEIAGDSPSNTPESRWKEFWSWKSPNQVCFICLLPFVLIIAGSVMLGLVWAEAVPERSREAVLTCGMVSFFSGFIACVVANFFDACGACSRPTEFENDTMNQDTLFVDLGELGPSSNEPEEDGEESECQTSMVECSSNVIKIE